MFAMRAGGRRWRAESWWEKNAIIPKPPDGHPLLPSSLAALTTGWGLVGHGPDWKSGSRQMVICNRHVNVNPIKMFSF